ncbi:MAG: crossover junction endodeoxyribonuclease RuvC [Patescibacteria group bacterium]|jgi:crossover junction endodeoxyribonuclease RuvC
MIILGLDPGFARLGYGVVKKTGNTIQFHAAGVITTTTRETFPQRLITIRQELRQLIKKFRPDQVGIERLYFFKNVTTAFGVGQAIGVITLTLAEAKLPTTELTPLQIKSILTGYGQASKPQVQKALRLIFRLNRAPKPDDAADGLACAYCAALGSMRPQIKNSK